MLIFRNQLYLEKLQELHQIENGLVSILFALSSFVKKLNTSNSSSSTKIALLRLKAAKQKLEQLIHSSPLQANFIHSQHYRTTGCPKKGIDGKLLF